MAGVEIALAVAPVAFEAAIAAWKVLDDTLSFEDDAQDLVLRLERAKGLLTIWASQSGLAEGTLLPALLPIEEIIARTLARVSGLISDLQQDGKKYGLATGDAQGAERRTTATTVMQMRRSLHAMVQTPRANSALARLLDDEASKQSFTRPDKVGLAPRVYWALRDRKKFVLVVEMLEKHVDGLVHLLHQTQMRDMQQQLTRLDLQVVQQLSDAGALSQLQALSRRQPDVSDMDVASLAEWKVLTLEGVSSPGRPPSEVEDWGLRLGRTDRAVRSRSRFVRKGQADPDMLYLFEKKVYDANISDTDKDVLQERIRNLVALLGGPGARRQLHTLKAVGYVDDPELHCWWIIFRFPIATGVPEDLDKLEPLSLNKLFASSRKPALETRYKLARRLTQTFSRLYGSAWMHKSVNSGNIIFPHLLSAETLNAFTAINTALVQGFGYSRQHTEAQTIDRGRVNNDLEAAIYRHPNYQGETASGYQLHYDIYSLGLVLFEIALWQPLMAMLAVKPLPGREPPVKLSPDMEDFHEVEARELKRRVDMRVEAELAYRMGTRYKVAVQWCLNLSGSVTATEFYDKVAVPVEELSSSG